MAFWNRRKKKTRYHYDTYDPYGDVLRPFTTQSDTSPVQAGSTSDSACDSSYSGDSGGGFDSGGGCE